MKKQYECPDAQIVNLAALTQIALLEYQSEQDDDTYDSEQSVEHGGRD